VQPARASVIFACVDVQQEPSIAVEPREVFGTDFAHGETREGVCDTELAVRNPCGEVPGRAPRVRGAQRVQASVCVSRHGRLDVASSLDDAGQKRRGQERHVARKHQHLLGWRLHERGVHTAQRAGIGYTVRDNADIIGPRSSIACDDQNIRRQAAQQRQLRLENRAAADEERALVGAAKPPRPAAGEDGCCPGNMLIRP
jgi:hypothetical protein